MFDFKKLRFVSRVTAAYVKSIRIGPNYLPVRFNQKDVIQLEFGSEKIGT